MGNPPPAVNPEDRGAAAQRAAAAAQAAAGQQPPPGTQPPGAPAEQPAQEEPRYTPEQLADIKRLQALSSQLSPRALQCMENGESGKPGGPDFSRVLTHIPITNAGDSSSSDTYFTSYPPFTATDPQGGVAISYNPNTDALVGFAETGLRAADQLIDPRLKITGTLAAQCYFATHPQFVSLSSQDPAIITINGGSYALYDNVHLRFCSMIDYKPPDTKDSNGTTTRVAFNGRGGYGVLPLPTEVTVTGTQLENWMAANKIHPTEVCVYDVETEDRLEPRYRIAQYHDPVVWQKICQAAPRHNAIFGEDTAIFEAVKAAYCSPDPQNIFASMPELADHNNLPPELNDPSTVVTRLFPVYDQQGGMSVELLTTEEANRRRSDAEGRQVVINEIGFPNNYMGFFTWDQLQPVIKRAGVDETWRSPLMEITHPDPNQPGETTRSQGYYLYGVKTNVHDKSCTENRLTEGNGKEGQRVQKVSLDLSMVPEDKRDAAKRLLIEIAGTEYAQTCSADTEFSMFNPSTKNVGMLSDIRLAFEGDNWTDFKNELFSTTYESAYAVLTARIPNLTKRINKAFPTDLAKSDMIAQINKIIPERHDTTADHMATFGVFGGLTATTAIIGLIARAIIKRRGGGGGGGSGGGNYTQVNHHHYYENGANAVEEKVVIDATAEMTAITVAAAVTTFASTAFDTLAGVAGAGIDAVNDTLMAHEDTFRNVAISIGAGAAATAGIMTAVNAFLVADDATVVGVADDPALIVTVPAWALSAGVAALAAALIPDAEQEILGDNGEVF